MKFARLHEFWLHWRCFKLFTSMIQALLYCCQDIHTEQQSIVLLDGLQMRLFPLHSSIFAIASYFVYTTFLVKIFKGNEIWAAMVWHSHLALPNEMYTNLFAALSLCSSFRKSRWSPQFWTMSFCSLSLHSLHAKSKSALSKFCMVDMFWNVYLRENISLYSCWYCSSSTLTSE